MQFKINKIIKLAQAANQVSLTNDCIMNETAKKESFLYQSISLLPNIKHRQIFFLIDGRVLSVFAEIRHLFVSQ